MQLRAVHVVAVDVPLLVHADPAAAWRVGGKFPVGQHVAAPVAVPVQGRPVGVAMDDDVRSRGREQGLYGAGGG